MYTGYSRQLSGDDERRVSAVYDERHRNKLSGGESMPDGQYIVSSRSSHVHLHSRVLFHWRHDRRGRRSGVHGLWRGNIFFSCKRYVVHTM